MSVRMKSLLFCWAMIPCIVKLPAKMPSIFVCTSKSVSGECWSSRGAWSRPVKRSWFTPAGSTISTAWALALNLTSASGSYVCQMAGSMTPFEKSSDLIGVLFRTR